MENISNKTVDGLAHYVTKSAADMVIIMKATWVLSIDLRHLNVMR